MNILIQTQKIVMSLLLIDLYFSAVEYQTSYIAMVEYIFDSQFLR